jgi:outer membrane protein
MRSHVTASTMERGWLGKTSALRKLQHLAGVLLFGLGVSTGAWPLQSTVLLPNPPRMSRETFLSSTQAQAGSTTNTQAGSTHEGDNAQQITITMSEAIRMALEHNLDIQVEQADKEIANYGVTRAEGGGIPRQINFLVTDTPVGEGPTVVPLFSSPSIVVSPTSVDPSAVSVSTSYDTSHVLGSQRSLELSSSPFAPGTAVPGYDAAFQGQFAWFRRNPSPATLATPSTAVNPADLVTTDNTLANTTLLKGFSTGAAIQLGINDFVQSFYSGRSSAVPFTHPNAIALFAQPLLRGAGRSNNTRYIAIAKNNTRISKQVLEAQVIATISGVQNLYYDLVSLQDSVAVQQKALDTAETLLSNDRQQLNLGRMAPIDVAQAEALVESVRLGLMQAGALRDQQEVVLQSVLDPASLLGEKGPFTKLVAIDELTPPADVLASVDDLVRTALAKRPDLQQAKLQISNSEKFVAADKNATRPELDLYGEFQSRGVIVPSLIPIGGDPITGTALLTTVPTGGTRSSRIYSFGLQFNLPVQNRVAQADLGADQVQLRQQRLRLTQLEAQVAAEVRNGLIGLNAAKQAARTAAASRGLQEQLLAAEQEKFQSGRATNFSVIQQQAYLAQAQATEIVAKAAWNKAAAQLSRALGLTLEQNGIALEAHGGN